VLSKLKASPRDYPSLNLYFSPLRPISDPVTLELPSNGLRLRFDGPDQRLRLVEMIDFSKIKLAYNNTEIVKFPVIEPGQRPAPPVLGPTFRHVYNRLFGPSFPGEYIPPTGGATHGTYILSYPGVAFNFPVLDAAWNPKVDFVSLLSSSAASSAMSMAVFSGQSWAEARATLYTRQPLYPRRLTLGTRLKEGEVDEVDLVTIHGEGRLELTRRFGPPLWIILSETTPQDLVAALGPPDAIYRKNDRRLNIHKAGVNTDRARSYSGTRDDTTDTEVSSMPTTDDDQDEDADFSQQKGDIDSAEVFWNYFHHGFDIFLSFPTTPSPAVPGSAPVRASTAPSSSTSLRATKIILHGNIPGSYPFNRHRRSRWRLSNIPSDIDDDGLSSEMPFSVIAPALKEAWHPYYSSKEEERALQQGMVLNRDWGDSPGSSCELLGGWEESLGSTKKLDPSDLGEVEGIALGNTQLFGFPGMVFEILKNDAVSCLTIF
jgi:isoleucyl-tRNA synthetase